MRLTPIGRAVLVTPIGRASRLLRPTLGAGGDRLVQVGRLLDREGDLMVVDAGGERVGGGTFTAYERSHRLQKRRDGDLLVVVAPPDVRIAEQHPVTERDVV